MKTEKKAKIVAAVWGTELIQFLVALAIFHQEDLKKRINRIMDSWMEWMEWMHSSTVRPATNSNNLCLLFCLYPSSLLLSKQSLK